MPSPSIRAVTRKLVAWPAPIIAVLRPVSCQVSPCWTAAVVTHSGSPCASASSCARIGRAEPVMMSPSRSGASARSRPAATTATSTKGARTSARPNSSAMIALSKALPPSPPAASGMPAMNQPCSAANCQTAPKSSLARTSRAMPQRRRPSRSITCSSLGMNGMAMAQARSNWAAMMLRCTSLVPP